MKIAAPRRRPVAVDCVLDARAGIGEGALWCTREQVLWWVEILEKRLHRFDPTTGIDTVFTLPATIGSVALRLDGGLVLALDSGMALCDGRGLRTIPDTAPPGSGIRYNDGVVSPEGRFLATTMPITPPFDQPVHALRVLDHDLRVRALASGLLIGNGLAFSPDGRTLYLSDSHPSRRRIWAFDWDSDSGRALNRRLFFNASRIPGHPDGAAVDVDGCYWYASAYGWCVVRLTPQGRVDRVIPVPVQKPTKPAFGGPGLDIMYVTSIGTNLEPGSEAKQPHAGGIFAFDPGVQGLPPARFGDPIHPPKPHPDQPT